MAETTSEYEYHYRAVAFLDVLGFQQKLNVFESEAIEYHDNDANASGRYISGKANDFIDTIKNVVGLLDVRKYRYYLFSDNICITSVEETAEEDLQDLLLVISRLYFEFIKRGYFLRGGIDFGLFIDEDLIAVGKPLANAYQMEATVAVFPRILLSDSFVDKFKEFTLNGEKAYQQFYSRALIMESDNPKFLNVFVHVFQSDYRSDRETFFKNFHDAISVNIEANQNDEHVLAKYNWLAKEFNSFVDLFSNELAYQDSDFDPDSEEGFLDFVVEQKIAYAQ